MLPGSGKAAIGKTAEKKFLSSRKERKSALNNIRKFSSQKIDCRPAITIGKGHLIAPILFKKDFHHKHKRLGAAHKAGIQRPSLKSGVFSGRSL